MNDKMNLVVEHTANQERREKILQSVRQYNDSASAWHQKIRHDGGTPLDLYAFDQRDQLIGGLISETFWGWLAIDYLWVTDEHRHFGLGSFLVLEAETIAAETRQVERVKVSTFSFQAPSFYLKLGYTITGEMKDYPPGQTMFWMRKELPPPNLSGSSESP